MITIFLAADYRHAVTVACPKNQNDHATQLYIIDTINLPVLHFQARKKWPDEPTSQFPPCWPILHLPQIFSHQAWPELTCVILNGLASEGGPGFNRNPPCDLLMRSPQLLWTKIITFTFDPSAATMNVQSWGGSGESQYENSHCQ